METISAFDNFGLTAMEGLCNGIRGYDDEALSALWKARTEQET